MLYELRRDIIICILFLGLARFAIAAGTRKSDAKTGVVRRQPRCSIRDTGVALKVIMIMTNVSVSCSVVFLHLESIS